MSSAGNGAPSGSRRSPSSPPRHGHNPQYPGPPPPPPGYGYNSGGYGRSQGRGYGGPSGPAVVGWTPRTPGNMRTGGGRGPPYGNHRMPPPGASRVPPGASRSGPSPSPRAADPGANGTPSWLKGAYRAPKPNVHVSSVAPTEQTVDSWCQARLEAIRATVDGADTIPELRKVMDDLEYEKIEIELDIARKARRERWHASERFRKTDIEAHATERPMRKIDIAAEHIESKLARLQSYSLFIDNNWTDGETEKEVSPAES